MKVRFENGQMYVRSGWKMRRVVCGCLTKWLYNRSTTIGAEGVCEICLYRYWLEGNLRPSAKWWPKRRL